MSNQQMPLSEDAIQEQTPLPIVALDVARVESTPRSVCCPHCSRDVSDSRSSHQLDANKLDEPGIRARSIESIAVYGWHCEACNLILPLDSELARREPEVAPPFEGWTTADITSTKGARIRGYVPAREVLGK